MDTAQTEKLKALALAADKVAAAMGQWLSLYEIADGITIDALAAFIAECNPATVLDLIADNERLRADVETRDALLRALNAVAIERGDKYGACDCIDNKGNPYPSQHLADILSVSAPVAGAKEKA